MRIELALILAIAAAAAAAAAAITAVIVLRVLRIAGAGSARVRPLGKKIFGFDWRRHFQLQKKLSLNDKSVRRRRRFRYGQVKFTYHIF